MKNIIIHFACFLLLAHALQAQIHIPYLNQPPQIDGSSEEWNLSDVNQFQSKAKNVPSANLVKYAFGYDEQNLYGVFKIADKQLTDLALDKSGSPRLTFNDAIEIYIDAKNNSKSQMDISDYQIIIDLNGHVTVFRGGDRFLLQVEEARVPKDTITNNFVIDIKTSQQGTINNEQDKDNGYTIEFRLPWASLGVIPIEGESFKLDICFNDADKFLDIKPLPDSTSIPFYSYESITGNTDFGYPDKWTKAVLTGKASWWKKLNDSYGHYWWILSLMIILIFIPIIIFLSIRNNKLRSIQPKSPDVDKKLASISTEGNYRRDIEASDENTFLKKAKQYVINNLEKDITPNELAQEMATSIRQLQRTFKDELSITPNTFITTIKMEEAAILLKAKEMNISEVAYAVGFSDPAYFTKVFKKYFNQNPKHYIKG